MQAIFSGNLEPRPRERIVVERQLTPLWDGIPRRWDGVGAWNRRLTVEKMMLHKGVEEAIGQQRIPDGGSKIDLSPASTENLRLALLRARTAPI
jgi:hypothetical protein